jgi:uncharacterized protein (TIGR03437 family)
MTTLNAATANVILGSGPAIAITSPTTSPTLTTSSSTVNLSGTASASMGITQVTWVTNRGASGTATGTSSWSINGMALQSGTTAVTVTARDGAGNTGSAVLTVTSTGSDTTPPTVTITSPTTALTLNVGSSTLNLGGTASDNVGVSQVTWATNKGASGTATGTANWTVNGLVLVSGSTTVTVTARDAAGNVSSKTLTVNYTPGADTIPPTVTITTPTSALAWNAPNSTLNLAGAASDNVGVSQVTWTTDRGASGTATGTTSWTISGMVLLSGTTIVTVTARDAAGNVANRALTVTYTPGGDAVAPAVTITSPTSGSTFSTSYSVLSLGGTASDNVGVSQVTWSTNRGASGTATGTSNWTINGLVLAVGDTYVTVIARDAAGNIASRTLLVSYTPLGTVSVAITSPTSQSTYYASQKTISLAGHASANTTQVNWVADQGQGQATGTTAWTAPGIDLRNGSNQITVTATDGDGNQSTALMTVIFIPPAITITSLPNAQVGKHYSYPLTAVGGTPPFTWTATHLPDGLSAGPDGLITGKPLKMGTYAVDLTVQDSVQATASATVSMQVGNGLTLVSAATLTAGPVAPESWAAAFGSQLADTTLSMMTSPVPIKLGESTVTVRDANGVERAAGMNYVSATHINFTIPTDTAVGPATVTVYSGNEVRGVGTLDIATVAPGIFFINQDGLANAGLLRIQGDSYAYESIIKLDPGTNQYVGLPIDLGSATDQVYLTLYGTGWRFRPSLESVSVTIGGLPMPVVYAGAAGYYDDVDIVNVLLTPQLRGRGKVDIVLTVNGVTANIVRVRLQ